MTGVLCARDNSSRLLFRVAERTLASPHRKFGSSPRSSPIEVAQIAGNIFGRPHEPEVTRPRTAPLRAGRAAVWLVSSGCSRRFQRAQVEVLGAADWCGRRVCVGVVGVVWRRVHPTTTTPAPRARTRRRRSNLAINSERRYTYYRLSLPRLRRSLGLLRILDM